MDCLKNLTACMGCTKKHAKCSWKDVRVDELQDGRPMPDQGSPAMVEEEPGPVSATSTADGSPPPHQNGASEPSKDEKQETPGPGSAYPAPASIEDKVDAASPRFDVRPPPTGQQLREAANGRSLYPHYSFYPHVKDSIEHDDNDEGDRLQALAAQVYRSASQSVRPQES